jgi:hypothetical protein
MTGASVGEAGRVRVATVITRLEGGAGAQALRGARTLNQNAFEIVVITSSGVLGRLCRQRTPPDLLVSP